MQYALSQFSKEIDIKKLKKDSQALSALYREGKTLQTEEALLTYLIVRMPATYAALTSVLSHILPGNSILDLGAGPGTVWWVACPALVTAVEREERFIEFGKKLGTQATWIQSDILSFKQFPPHEWVTFGYSLGELPEKCIPALLDKCWEAADKGIVIVEPGTPRGYQRTLLARDYLITKGGCLLAPCPHSNKCPLQDDWCHFSVRLNRSFWHREAKQGELPYEDEKFSYAILTKEKNTNLCPRIIRPPLHHPGHTKLSLCTQSGIQNITVARSQKELYKKARKSRWGEVFNVDPTI